MVVELHKLFAQRVLRVGNAAGDGNIQHNCERLRVHVVGDGRIIFAQKRQIVGMLIIHNQHFLVGKARLNQRLHALRCAYTVPIDARMPEEHNRVVFLDLLQNLMLYIHLFAFSYHFIQIMQHGHCFLAIFQRRAAGFHVPAAAVFDGNRVDVEAA